MDLYPQLAKQAEVTNLTHYINDDRWIMEQKLDGHRVLLVSGGEHKPTALTRSGSLYSRKLPQDILDYRFPKVAALLGGNDGATGEWVLDGELVGEAVNGHTVSSTYWVFDVLQAPGLDEGSPLWMRRAYLEAFFEKFSGHPFKLAPQAKTSSEKIALSDTALKNNFEGLVLKDTQSPYRPGGRTPEWLKVKFVKTADCIVLGVRDDGKDSVKLGMIEHGDPQFPNGKPVEVGRSSLIGKEKNGALAVGDVIEVRYLYVGAGGRLYQPTIMRKRVDKAMHECTTDQMVFVNKEVLESLGKPVQDAEVAAAIASIQEAL